MDQLSSGSQFRSLRLKPPFFLSRDADHSPTERRNCDQRTVWYSWYVYDPAYSCARTRFETRSCPFPGLPEFGLRPSIQRNWIACSQGETTTQFCRWVTLEPRCVAYGFSARWMAPNGDTFLHPCTRGGDSVIVCFGSVETSQRARINLDVTSRRRALRLPHWPSPR